MDDSTQNYDVGYGKPPKEARFAKGQSGNPKGRPKGAKNFARTFHEVTQELIHVKENGRDKTMTKLEALFRQLVGKAMSGDFKATKEILQWNRLFEDAAERDAVDGPDVEKDNVVMKSFLKRVLEAQTINEPKPISTEKASNDVE
jgi:Family of unknown function (DUF5681)